MGSVELVGSALFGATRQAVLRLLFGHADERFYLRQISLEMQEMRELALSLRSAIEAWMPGMHPGLR